MNHGPLAPSHQQLAVGRLSPRIRYSTTRTPGARANGGKDEGGGIIPSSSRLCVFHERNRSPVPPFGFQPIAYDPGVKSTQPSIRAARLAQALHTYCDTKRGPLTLVRMPDCSALSHYEGDPAESSVLVHTLSWPAGNRSSGPVVHSRASVPSAPGRRYSRADER
jgi:hypothetical protein